VVAGLPGSAFSTPALGDTFIARLEAIEPLIAQGQRAAAIIAIGDLRRRVDGCGGTADQNDWIVVCADQVVVRGLLDLLATNLAT
jgi:hypothetical protein